MSALLAWLLLAPGSGDGPAPASFETRAAEIAGHLGRREWPQAIAASDAALAEDRTAALGEREAALVHLARGFALLSRELEPPAARPADAGADDGLAAAGADFSSARALAGPTALRLDATFDLALCSFHAGERARARLPEISGSAGGAGAPAQGGLPPGLQPPGAPPTPGAGAGPAQAEDPLAAARTAYGQTKGLLLERLRADWRDPDTRANLELVQRRLKELDEIEKKRKEEEQKQQQQQNQKNDQDQKDSKQDKDQKHDPQKDGKKDDQGQGQGQDSQDPQKDQQKKDEPQDGQQPPQPNPQDPSQPPEPQDGTPEKPEGAQDAGDKSQDAGAERHLTREEALQLLDKLAELEKQAGALEAALREARRVPVARDW